MPIPKCIGVALVLGLCANSLLAQNTAPATPSYAQHPRQQPCWLQAGMSKSAALQLRQIEESTHSQLESVCSDSSLNAQQRHQKIQQLHQQAKQEAEGIVNVQQLEALRSCREQRGHSEMHSGGGPCGSPVGAPAQGSGPLK